MNLWIVIPTYNEKENLTRLVPALWKLEITGLHLLIVDDNSLDGTGHLADRLEKETRGRLQCLHRSGKLGLGTAYLHGFAFALKNGAARIGQMDADFSHPVEKIPEMLQSLEDTDVVIGSRYVAGGSLDKDWALWRKQLSSFGNTYARTILHSNGYVFQVEMNYLALLLGFRFKEIPIYFAERQWGESKMSFQIQAEAALEVWQLPGRYRDIKPIQAPI
jgi:dolichol-phosphate mannosyltransferase